MNEHLVGVRLHSVRWSRTQPPHGPRRIIDKSTRTIVFLGLVSAFITCCQEFAQTEVKSYSKTQAGLGDELYATRAHAPDADVVSLGELSHQVPRQASREYERASRA